MAAEIETIIEGRPRDLGGIQVRRVLPWMRHRTVGPFVFFDHMGPHVMPPGTGIDVRPHPHICLSTLTYLFAGELTHRDSLGVVQVIKPGEVNWMTAGRGIVHSERTPDELRRQGGLAHGIQVWLGHPQKDEEIEPSFAHHPAGDLPKVNIDGNTIHLITGSLFGIQSPVHTLSEMFYADVRMETGARIAIPPAYPERAVYVVEGAVGAEESDAVYSTGRMLVFKPGAPIELHALGGEGTRVMVFGGEPLDGIRHVYWNFVASSKKRIEKAKADWRAGRFPPVPGETEFIPLPDGGPAEVTYP